MVWRPGMDSHAQGLARISQGHTHSRVSQTAKQIQYKQETHQAPIVYPRGEETGEPYISLES